MGDIIPIEQKTLDSSKSKDLDSKSIEDELEGNFDKYYDLATKSKSMWPAVWSFLETDDSISNVKSKLDVAVDLNVISEGESVEYMLLYNDFKTGVRYQAAKSESVEGLGAVTGDAAIIPGIITGFALGILGTSHWYGLDGPATLQGVLTMVAPMILGGYVCNKKFDTPKRAHAKQCSRNVHLIYDQLAFKANALINKLNDPTNDAQYALKGMDKKEAEAMYSLRLSLLIVISWGREFDALGFDDPIALPESTDASLS